MVKRSSILFADFLNILASDFSMSGMRSWLKISKFWFMVWPTISPRTLSPPKKSSSLIWPFWSLIFMSILLTTKCVWPLICFWIPLILTVPSPPVKLPENVPTPFTGMKSIFPSTLYAPSTYKSGSSIWNEYFDAYSTMLKGETRSHQVFWKLNKKFPTLNSWAPS